MTEIDDKLNTLVKQLEVFLDVKGASSFEIKKYDYEVTVSFDWEYYFGNFIITPSKGGGFIVEDEYYTEEFDTVQQVADYLLKKDNDNAR